MACAICETRKEKRFCPAVHGRICPACCGTQREVTLDCPSSCDYLQQARRNERRRPLSEIERDALFPDVRLPENAAGLREALLDALGYAIVQAGLRNRSLLDRDVVAALTGVAKSYETLVASGLVYDAPLGSPLQQTVAYELRQTIAQYQASAKPQLGYASATDREILQALVFFVRFALQLGNGRPRSRAFLDKLEQDYPQRDSVLVTPQDPRSRLIVP